MFILTKCPKLGAMTGAEIVPRPAWGSFDSSFRSSLRMTPQSSRSSIPPRRKHFIGDACRFHGWSDVVEAHDMGPPQDAGDHRSERSKKAIGRPRILAGPL